MRSGMTRNEILLQLQQEYADRRSANHLEEQRRRREAEAAVPQLAETLSAREQLIYDGLRGILRGQVQADDLPKRMDVLNRRVASLLKASGRPENWLDPVYTCPLCRDTGYVGEPIRELCSCMRSAMNRRLYAEVGLSGTGEESFERFDEKVFPDKYLPSKGCSQRRLMLTIRQVCETWADTYPHDRRQDMVLSGKSGLGKTWMLHAMAKRLLDRGYEVLLISAYRFMELAKKARFSREEHADAGLQAMMDAPVLMLDDLGTEPFMDNVTITELFNLLNERQQRKLPTVISTNLSEKELRERYTERVTSRLLDRRSCAFVPFDGDDLRRL